MRGTLFQTVVQTALSRLSITCMKTQRPVKKRKTVGELILILCENTALTRLISDFGQQENPLEETWNHFDHGVQE